MTKYTFPATLTFVLLAQVCRAEIVVRAVTDLAAFVESLTVEGSLVTIFCTGLEDIDPAQAASFPLPTSLSGVAVRIGGVPAPLLSVSRLNGYQQINLQLPFGQTLEGNSDFLAVVVEHRGLSGRRLVRPGGFASLFRDGNNYGIFVRASDWTLIGPSNRAKPGELLITFSTALGGPSPVPAGMPNPTPALAIAGNLNRGQSTGNRFTPGTVHSLGAWWAPGLAGVQQIHVEAPLTVPASGMVEVALEYVNCMPTFPGGMPQRCLVNPGKPVILWMQPAGLPQ